MIITRLAGGLGNQLFQYAFGRQLAEINTTELKLDATLYENYPHHAYSLSPFNVIEHFATKEEVAAYKRYKTRDGRRWMLYNFFIGDTRRYVRETQFNFNPANFKARPNAYLDGYWQTEKYFKGIEDIIRKEFTLKVPLSETSQEIAQSMKKREAVSLHVRRGLYVTDPKFSAHHGVCSPEYFERAIARISEQVPHPHFYVFSNDHQWAREYIRPQHEVTYIEHTGDSTDYEDIILMSMCGHHILANSTFSWWGAWLNPSPEKIVIAPSQWFKSAKYDTSDVLPAGWISL